MTPNAAGGSALMWLMDCQPQVVIFLLACSIIGAGSSCPFAMSPVFIYLLSCCVASRGWSARWCTLT